MKVAVESLSKMDDVSEATPAAPSALQVEAELPFQLLRVALKEYCLVKDTSFDEQDAPHERTGLLLCNRT